MTEINNCFGIPGTVAKYIIRKTGEEIEVVAFNNESNGERSDKDWVTFIDSNRQEHIKEHLNIQLDLKASNGFNDTLEKLMKFSPQKQPSYLNVRLYETTKDLVINGFKDDIDTAFDLT